MTIRESVAEFARLMEHQLDRHDRGTQGWKESANTCLLIRLKAEVKELEDALINGHDIARECADVANFAMMIADNTGY